MFCGTFADSLIGCYPDVIQEGEKKTAGAKLLRVGDRWVVGKGALMSGICF